MFNTRRMAVIAVFVALATVLNIVERSVLVPGLPPGVKPGLANVMTLLSILTLGFRDAFYCCCQVFHGSTNCRQSGQLLISFTGGVFSTLVMVVMWRYFNKVVSIVRSAWLEPSP